MLSYFVKLFGGVRPSQVKPLAMTLVIVVVYVPDGDFFKVKPASPVLLVVPVAVQDLFPFESWIEIDAPLTLFPESSDIRTDTVRCLSLFFPPSGEYAIESTPTAGELFIGTLECGSLRRRSGTGAGYRKFIQSLSS